MSTAEGEFTNYLIYFVNNMDPNGPRSQACPRSPILLTFNDGLLAHLAFASDNYRAKTMESLILKHTL
ncbi:hypothetical protein C8J56DRAFT_941118 [Mycena floridula]|nr:hypothetical protein C8J56DRAFT_941118 [Mycena floridula]